MTFLSRRTLLVTMLGSLGALGPGVAIAQERRRTLRFELHRDARGEFRWRLKGGNHRVLATSGEGYRTKASCRAAIDLIRVGAGQASVDDLT